MSLVINRIAEFIESINMSHRQFSISLDKSPSYIHRMVKQGSVPSAELLENIMRKYPDLNVRWVLTGQGQMIMDSAPSAPKSIDDAIDDKIDSRFRKLEEALKQLIADQIDDEIERTRKEIQKSKNGA